MADRICSIEDCLGPYVARGWCSKHYQRWKLHGDAAYGGDVPDLRRARKRNVCKIDGCDGPAYGHGYCQTHYAKWRRFGDPLYDRFSKPVSYSGMHRRVRSLRGDPAACPCTRCGASAAVQWAYDHGDLDEICDGYEAHPYSLDASHYIPLCLPCHVRFDREHAARG